MYSDHEDIYTDHGSMVLVFDEVSNFIINRPLVFSVYDKMFLASLNISSEN